MAEATTRDASPTWADATIPEPEGPSLRCRRAGWGAAQPDGRWKEEVWPVGADGENLTRFPIAIQTRFDLGYPLPEAVNPFGRRSRVVVYRWASWRPWTAEKEHP